MGIGGFIADLRSRVHSQQGELLLCVDPLAQNKLGSKGNQTQFYFSSSRVSSHERDERVLRVLLFKQFFHFFFQAVGPGAHGPANKMGRPARTALGALVLTVAVFSWSCTARRAYALVEDPHLPSFPEGDGEGLTGAVQRHRRIEKRQIMADDDRSVVLAIGGQHADRCLLRR